ncbi:MAG: hypothetical protein SVM80_10200, partial [Halobacteriota archaeon]|nr:hypothetical protein [Halobacteriota archaeon]
GSTQQYLMVCDGDSNSGDSNVADMEMDWILVRQYTSPEPTVMVKVETPPSPTPHPKPSRGPSGGGGGGGFIPSEIKTNSRGRVQSTYTEESSDGKAKLIIPEGIIALDADGEPLKSVTINPTFVGGAIVAYNLGPDGATFDPGIDMIIKYDPDDIAEGKTVVIKVHDWEKWVPLETTVDTSANTANVKLSHFTVFALFAETEESPSLTMTREEESSSTPTPTPSSTPPAPEDKPPALAWIWILAMPIILGGIMIVVAAKRNGKDPLAMTPQPLLSDDENIIQFTTSIIEKMEIRVESVFRPNQEDVEIVYALSGSNPNILDKIHYLASCEVVLDSSSTFITTYTEMIIENILKEREDYPKVIVHIHTHPMGIPNLSETDKRDNLKIVEIIERFDPQVKIIFGVHAISSEAIRAKTEPKGSKNKIKWSSIHREHEIGFYDKEGKQYRVRIIE